MGSCVLAWLQNVKAVFDSAIKVVLQPPKKNKKKKARGGCSILWWVEDWSPTKMDQPASFLLLVSLLMSPFKIVGSSKPSLYSVCWHSGDFCESFKWFVSVFLLIINQSIVDDKHSFHTLFMLFMFKLHACISIYAMCMYCLMPSINCGTQFNWCHIVIIEPYVVISYNHFPFLSPILLDAP